MVHPATTIAPERTLKGSVARAAPGLVRAGRRVLQPRRFQLYGVGAPKSGTHSVARMFEGQYRASHEGHPTVSVDLLARRRAGLSGDQLRAELLVRDARVWAECESASFLAWFVDELGVMFPDASFVVPVRDCRSWVDSVIDQHRNHSSREPFLTLRRLYFGERPSTPGDEGLPAHGHRPLENFVSYWRDHHEFLLRHLDDDRSLWVWLPELASSRPRLERLIGAPIHDAAGGRAHAYRAPEKHRTLDRLETDVEGTIRAIAGDTAAALAERLGRRPDELLGL